MRAASCPPLASGQGIAQLKLTHWKGLGPLQTGIIETLPMSQMGVHREKAALSSGCKPHPATAPAGSNRSSHEGNEMAEAFG